MTNLRSYIACVWGGGRVVERGGAEVFGDGVTREGGGRGGGVEVQGRVERGIMADINSPGIRQRMGNIQL